MNRCLRAAVALFLVFSSLRVLSMRRTAPRPDPLQEASIEDRFVHLTSPRDSERVLAGTQDNPPAFLSPVRFTWTPLGGDTKYFWTLDAVDAGGRLQETVLKDETAAHDMELSLPRSLPGQRYVFKLEAYEAGKRVAAVKMRVGRGRRGDFFFRVR